MQHAMKKMFIAQYQVVEYIGGREFRKGAAFRKKVSLPYRYTVELFFGAFSYVVQAGF